MFDPLRKITHHQKLGLKSYLFGHTEAFGEKVQKVTFLSTGFGPIIFQNLKN